MRSYAKIIAMQIIQSVSETDDLFEESGKGDKME